MSRRKGNADPGRRFLGTVLVRSGERPPFWKHRPDHPELGDYNGVPVWRRWFEHHSRAAHWCAITAAQKDYGGHAWMIEEQTPGGLVVVESRMTASVPYTPEEWGRFVVLHSKPVPVVVQVELDPQLHSHLVVIARSRGRRLESLAGDVLAEWAGRVVASLKSD